MKLKVLLAISISILLASCAGVAPTQYSMSADNQVALKDYASKKIEIADIKATHPPIGICRLVGPIDPLNGKPMSEFIRDAFNSEFKLAGIYSSEGVKINAELFQLEFSSANVSAGYWAMGLNLKSSNGSEMKKSIMTKFKTGFAGVGACNNTSLAFGGAVQELIKSVVSDPEFKKLLE